MSNNWTFDDTSSYKGERLYLFTPSFAAKPRCGTIGASVTGRIVFDATYSVGTNLSGVGVYCREIMRALTDAHPDQRFAAAFRSQRFLPSFRQALPANCARTLLWDGGVLARPRLFHGLNQRMPRFQTKRRCCTFHDLFVMTGEYSTAEFRERFAKQARDAAQRADLVICVSQFTAEQVYALLNVERAKLRVVHHGCVRRGVLPVARESIVLSVGALQKRKNVLRLVEAFERASVAPWRLVLAGSTGYGGDQILARVETSVARDRIDVAGYVDDEALTSLYSRASLFAFPTLDEGFGMPALDAMACGVPVLASNRSAVPEVCGDAALLVNPDSTDEMAEALVRLMRDENLRKTLILRGQARSEEFTWERAAVRTWNVYRELD